LKKQISQSKGFSAKLSNNGPFDKTVSESDFIPDIKAEKDKNPLLSIPPDFQLNSCFIGKFLVNCLGYCEPNLNLNRFEISSSSKS